MASELFLYLVITSYFITFRRELMSKPLASLMVLIVALDADAKLIDDDK